MTPVRRPSLPLPPPITCVWRYHANGVTVRCGELVVPGTKWCAEHLIEHAAAKR